MKLAHVYSILCGCSQICVPSKKKIHPRVKILEELYQLYIDVVAPCINKKNECKTYPRKIIADEWMQVATIACHGPRSFIINQIHENKMYWTFPWFVNQFQVCCLYHCHLEENRWLCWLVPQIYKTIFNLLIWMVCEVTSSIMPPFFVIQNSPIWYPSVRV